MAKREKGVNENECARDILDVFFSSLNIVLLFVMNKPVRITALSASTYMNGAFVHLASVIGFSLK